MPALKQIIEDSLEIYNSQVSLFLQGFHAYCTSPSLHAMWGMIETLVSVLTGKIPVSSFVNTAPCEKNKCHLRRIREIRIHSPVFYHRNYVFYLHRIRLPAPSTGSDPLYATVSPGSARIYGSLSTRCRDIKRFCQRCEKLLARSLRTTIRLVGIVSQSGSSSQS